MSIEQIELFEKRLSRPENKKMNIRLWTADSELFVEVFVKLGAEHGFSFTPEEVAASGVCARFGQHLKSGEPLRGESRGDDVAGGLTGDVDGLLVIRGTRTDW